MILLTALIGLCALLCLLFLSVGARRLRHRRFVAGGVHCMAGGSFLLAAIAAGFLGFNLQTYERLTHEQPALELQFVRLGERSFRATLTFPSNRVQAFDLRGDEWQVDARVLKWQGLATILGFDTIYRIERISGRYGDIASEQRATRTVYALNEPDRVDVWELAHKLPAWAPWIDARYGSATYLPMADGALFQVTVSQTGLVARPLNQAAHQAVGGWR